MNDGESSESGLVVSFRFSNSLGALSSWSEDLCPV